MDITTRHAIWRSMADHFLDTDNRSFIPQTALLCVEAGLTPKESGDIWRFEVTPAVFHNMWSYLGEWAGWPSDWLFERIERKRGRWPNRQGVIGELIYRLRVFLMHSNWVAIAKTMELIASVPRAERAQLAGDLEAIVSAAFALVPSPPAEPSADEARRRLRAKSYAPILRSIS